MKRVRRQQSSEFKREAVALVVEHGYSCTTAGRSLGGEWRVKRAVEQS